MLRSVLCITLIAVSAAVTAQKASITVEHRDILTYPYDDPNPVPVLAEDRAEIYPYHIFNGYSSTGRMQKWMVVKLENDFIEVYVLPSDGGKVWGAIEKSTGREFIYRNEVMKYRNISMRGPWTSGGIEFNFGIIGHNPSTCVPVDYKTAENSDGSVSCYVGSLDLPSRTKWMVEVRLPADKAYFETRAMWNNPTPVPQPYYNWMTAAAVVTPDLQFMYPGNREIGHGGEAGPWPIDGTGRDLSMYANNNTGPDKSYHVVGEYNDFMGGYYHASAFGFGHWALADEMAGRKLWLWSQARSGAIWEDLLTDSDGQYMEFQAGRMFNQYSPSPSLKSPITQVPFPPGATDRWREIWFPVKSIGGFVDVSPHGVLNVKHQEGKLLVGINSLAFAQGKLTVRSDGEMIHSENISLKPMDVYQKILPVNSDRTCEVTVEGMDLQFSTSRKNFLERPFVTDISVKPPTPSWDYHEGMELKENHDYKAAKKLFLRCLGGDPLYIDAMAALIELYYRSMQYDSALHYARKALQLDTYHPAANYFTGITYLAKGDLINALESLGWAARSPEFRSPAYALMAGIKLQTGEDGLSEHYANLSLDHNRYNFNALQVLAILYRHSGRTALADSTIEFISKLDPLSHFADFERYLLHPTGENLARFSATITNEMPYQTYLELCTGYFGLGMKKEALQVLEKAPGNPLITLWKAYLENNPGLLEEIAGQPADFVFPYRTETLIPLMWAKSLNGNWKFRYYLALNYQAVQREEEAGQLLLSCGQEPDYAPFYLARASLLFSGDKEAELRDLESARRYAPDDWRVASRLIRYYEKTGNDGQALSIATAAFKQHKDNFTLGLQYARSLYYTGSYQSCLKVLEGMHILPSEGSYIGKVAYEQANLMLAIELIRKKKYQEAIKRIDQSREWPEELGVGSPFNPDNRLQDYLSAYCLGKLNRSNEAAGMQAEVLKFTEKNYKNPSVNNLMALLVYQSKGETDKAEKLIQEITSSTHGDHFLNKWVIATFRKDTAVSSKLEKEFDRDSYMPIVKAIAEL